jgi:iron complex transport system substrate-binding protein
MLAAGQAGLVGEIIRRAGGVNCVADPAKFARLSEEEVLRLQPEAYLIQRGPMNPAPLPLTQRPRLRGLPAAASGRAWFVDEQKYSRPGPRNLDAVEELALLLHPELKAAAPDKTSPKALAGKTSAPNTSARNKTSGQKDSK